MPILQGAITFARFFAEPRKTRPKDARRSLAKDLRAQAFEPLDKLGEQERTAGWVELHDNDSTELPPGRFLFGSRLLVTYRVDVRKVPAAMVRRELDAWGREFSVRQSRAPKRAEKAEQKELIIKRLRKRAFVTTQTVDVSWHQDRGEVLIWSSSRKMVDEIHVALEETFDLSMRARSPGVLADETGVASEVLAPSDALFGVALTYEGGSDAEA